MFIIVDIIHELCISTSQIQSSNVLHMALPRGDERRRFMTKYIKVLS
jgi:hypothetical protein